MFVLNGLAVVLNRARKCRLEFLVGWKGGVDGGVTVPLFCLSGGMA
jgi:hypothetical protein